MRLILFVASCDLSYLQLLSINVMSKTQPTRRRHHRKLMKCMCKQCALGVLFLCPSLRTPEYEASVVVA